MALKPGKLKKGKLGETIVDMYLMDRGVIPYQPVLENVAHPFDRLCASRDKRRLFVVEVKAKPARYAYPDTGINISHWNDYTNIEDTYGIDVYIFFVDEERREVYGGRLDDLAKATIIEDQERTLHYPMRQNGIIYFPLANMKTVAKLEDEQVERLEALRTTGFVKR